MVKVFIFLSALFKDKCVINMINMYELCDNTNWVESKNRILLTIFKATWITLKTHDVSIYVLTLCIITCNSVLLTG